MRWFRARPAMMDFTETDKNGMFEFFAGKGKYWISGTKQSEVEHFEIENQKQVKFVSRNPKPDR